MKYLLRKWTFNVCTKLLYLEITQSKNGGLQENIIYFRPYKWYKELKMSITGLYNNLDLVKLQPDEFYDNDIALKSLDKPEFKPFGRPKRRKGKEIEMAELFQEMMRLIRHVN